MVLVFYGLNDFLIKKEIEKLKKESNLTNIDYVKYDLEVTDISDILIDADEINLFGNKKMIEVSNSYIFTGTTSKKLKEQNTVPLETYFKNPNPNTILIFTIYKDKLDERKKIVKLAKEKGYLKEYNKINNTKEIVTELFKPYNITPNEITFFIERVGNNLSILEQEINKIKVYKNDDLNITHDDIINLTSKNIDLDIFNLIENIILNNKEKAITSYNEMLKMGEESIMILIMLANQFRMLYQVKKLYNKGYSENDISKELKVHWYPIRKCMEKMRNFDENKLLDYIYELAILDEKIKLGLIEKEIALEIFILEL